MSNTCSGKPNLKLHSAPSEVSYVHRPYKRDRGSEVTKRFVEIGTRQKVLKILMRREIKQAGKDRERVATRSHER